MYDRFRIEQDAVTMPQAVIELIIDKAEVQVEDDNVMLYIRNNVRGKRYKVIDVTDLEEE